jgi:septum site-determining protein MinD
MAQKIVVTSGKGGVGKTTVTANLGMCLSKMGLRVVLIDIDFGLNNLDVVLGVENKVIYDLSDVFEGRCRIKQALVQVGKRGNLFILASNSLESSVKISGQNIKLIIEGLDDLFDYIILDCPAGIDIGFHRAVSCANKAIVVTTPSLPSLRDADKVISILKSYKLDFVGLVINRARGDLIMSEKMLFPEDVMALLKTDLIGLLPEEDIVFLSSGDRLPEKTESYKGYKLLAMNLHKGTNKILNITKKYSGFWGSIRRRLKRNV